MKRNIIIGLSSIFVVVLVGGGFVASLMTKFSKYNIAYTEMDRVLTEIEELHTQILLAVSEINVAKEDPEELNRLVGQVTAISATLSRLKGEVNPKMVTGKGCGMCHDKPGELVQGLDHLLIRFEESFDDFTMMASMLITAREGDQTKDISRRLLDSLENIYSLVVALDNETTPMLEHIHVEMQSTISRVSKTHNTTVIITVLLVLAGMIFTIRAVTHPVRRLTRGTEAIVQGDYDHRIELEGKDELTLLAERFNYMAEVLSNRESRLVEKKEEFQELNETLERKVQERTVALRKKQEEINYKYLELESTNEELQASYVQLQTTAAELEEAQSRLQENYDMLQAMNKELKRANDVKNKFLSIMSHELRTPLTVINGYLSLVLEKNYGKPSKSLRDVLSVVKEQGVNQLHLIEDLLDLTRIESGEYKLDRQPCNPEEILRKIISSYKPSIDEKKITVTLDVEGDIPDVYWDYQKILQIFQNLLDNAQKFTPAGGWVAFSIKSKTDFVEIRVSDNGIGIPKEQQSYIFDRFYQVDSSSTRQFGGSGLGLSIVREIVIAHNGKIFVDSEEEKGTTFLILLPPGDPDSVSESYVEEGLEKASRAITSEKVAEGTGEKILVVDDDDAFLSMMSMILPRYGYDAYTTSDAGETLGFIKEHGIELVLLDLMMPDVDGYEVCRRIKKDKATKSIPVVVVSASGGKEITRKIKEAGADDHLVKPFDHDEILNVISDYLKAAKKGPQKPAASPKSQGGEHRDTTD